MGLTSSLFSGVSGLSVLGDAMTVIGDNIANVNTVGFKSSRVTFQDVLSAVADCVLLRVFSAVTGHQNQKRCCTQSRSGTELGDDEETTESETSTASSQPAADSDTPPTLPETPEGLDPEEAPVSDVG